MDNLKKIIMGFDMDGVIIDHASRKIVLAKELGFKVKKNETPSEIIKNLLPEKEYKKLQYFLYNHPKTSLCSPLMPGARIILSKMQKNGTSFFLISRRRKQKLSKKLLKKLGLWPKFFNETNTFFIKEIGDKEIVAKKLGITHYVDDEKRVLDSLVSVKHKFIFDPFAGLKNPPYRRIKSWREISKLI